MYVLRLVIRRLKILTRIKETFFLSFACSSSYLEGAFEFEFDRWPKIKEDKCEGLGDRAGPRNLYLETFG